MPSEFFFFFKNLLAKSCKAFFKGSNYKFSGLLFRRYFKNGYFDTSTSNYLKIKFLEIFLYRFYMFNLHNFFFFLINLKNDYCLLRMVWLLNSEGMKKCKSTESFCHSILAVYTNDWSTFWDVYCCFVFFSGKLLNVCKLRTTFYALWQPGPPGLAF